MNLFNRLVVAVLAAGVMTCGGLVAAMAAGFLTPEQLAPAPSLRALAESIRELPGSDLLAAGLAGGVVMLAGLILLAYEVRGPRERREIVIRADRLGRVSVSLSGLRRLADHVITEVPGVEAVVSDARPARDAVQFHCRISLKPEASAPELAEEIRMRLGAAVQQHTGLQAAPIHIHSQVGLRALDKKRVR